MWGCAKCGRVYYPEQVAPGGNPTCPNCGTQFPLNPWMESKRWTFLLFGFIGLPVVGVVLVKVVGGAGLSSPLARQACYFALPVLMLLMNLPSYLIGQPSNHQIMKRGGKQGLLAVAGFVLFTLIALITGYYHSVVGLSPR